MFIGCAGGDSARPSADTARMDEALSTVIQSDIDALADRHIPAAVRAMHWAVLRTNNQVTALRIDALTPDDRYVEIHAQQGMGDQIDVQVHVGYFGDEVVERQFLQQLQAEVSRSR